MTKSDCYSYMFCPTTASNGSEEMKIWYAKEFESKGSSNFTWRYFLDNGAECTHLIVKGEDGRYWYQGGGWLERLLGKSFKGTSEDVDKLKKYILYGAIAIALLALVAPTGIALIKKLKTQHI